MNADGRGWARPGMARPGMDGQRKARQGLTMITIQTRADGTIAAIYVSDDHAHAWHWLPQYTTQMMREIAWQAACRGSGLDWHGAALVLSAIRQFMGAKHEN